ncbi:hypothetical protein FA95DRAFT_1564942 [Auriscalpium vulgare]|uniref:Uncharacterized protein n=1 Tax=Auriscalpium vulgare TaxID=40419 RepID=A0ACB8RCH2_9AGAM|nr:hypothetical protein FA95DRAFT_1564942 [Auriscalpium vulgare]
MSPSSSPIRTLIGRWRSPEPHTDIEAQQPIVGRYEPFSLDSPAALHTHAPRTTSTPASPSTTYNAVDLFFGVNSPKRGTLDSRHDERPAPSALSPTATDLPPAYAYPLPAPLPLSFDEEDELPSYAHSVEPRDNAEPVTLAHYFFKYGFLCPPLWFASILILCSPLAAPEDWEPTKTPSERAALLARMRATEVKWARRSIVAALILCIAVTLLVAIGVTASRK